MLEVDTPGKSALGIAHLLGPEFRPIPLVRSATVVRLKGSGRYKDRPFFCVGAVITHPRVSAPTPNRACVKLFIALCAAAQLSLASVGVIQ